MNAFSILVILALLLAIIDLIKPTAPLLPVSVILICAALLAGSAGWIKITTQ